VTDLRGQAANPRATYSPRIGLLWPTTLAHSQISLFILQD